MICVLHNVETKIGKLIKVVLKRNKNKKYVQTCISFFQDVAHMSRLELAFCGSEHDCLCPAYVYP